MLQRNYFDIAVEGARTMAQPPTVTLRELQLIEVARHMAQFLDYKTFGQHDRVNIARKLHEALMNYEDVEPCNDLDRIEWRKRRDERLQVDDPRR